MSCGRSATSGTREGATTLRAVLQSLPEDGQKQVAAAVIRRMGRANPSAQDDLGEAFSSERFLTMWNSMAPEAKRLEVMRAVVTFLERELGPGVD